MVASSRSSAQTRIQHILRISAQHFAISPLPVRPTPFAFLIASEFKDPIPLRLCAQARQIALHPARLAV
jgi:hypothetical protein